MGDRGAVESEGAEAIGAITDGALRRSRALALEQRSTVVLNFNFFDELRRKAAVW